MSFAVIGLDHVQLAMPRGGETTAEAFYAGLLGLTRLPKPEPQASRGGCWFVSGPVALHLGVEDDFRPAKKAHPALLIRESGGTRRCVDEGGVRGDPEPRPASGRGMLRRRPFREPPGIDRGRAQRDVLYEGVNAVSSGESAGGTMMGSCIDMRVPPPGSTSARMVPPSALTTWATIASPNPEPGRPRAAGAR